MLETAGQALAVGDLGRAERGYRDALAIDPRSSDALNGLGIVFTRAGRFDAGIEAFRRSLLATPQWVTGWSNLGRALRLRGWDDEAEAACRGAYMLQPSDDARCRFARQLLRLRRPERALIEAGAVLDGVTPGGAAPGDMARFEALQIQADALADLYRPDDALAACRTAVSMRPNQAPARRTLGMLLAEVGAFPDARDAFQACLRVAPSDTAAHYRLSLITRYRQDDPGTLFHLRQMAALEKFGTLGNGEQAWLLNFALAKAYDDLGVPARAFPFLEKANRLKRAALAYDVEADIAYMERIKRAYPGAAPERPGGLPAPPIFIIGMARSGSTLIAEILARHPMVTARGETPYFRKALNRRAAGIGAPGFFPETSAGFTDADWQAVSEMYLATARAGADGRIIDKLPYNFIHLPALRRAFLDATIIHSRRDPMDTCFSIYQNSFAEGHFHAYDQVELGRYYRAYANFMTHWQDERSCRVVEARYEDLVAAPETETRRLIAACGLPWEDACLTPGRSPRAIRTLSQHQVRQAVYGTSVGRWRPYEAALRPLLETLGDQRAL